MCCYCVEFYYCYESIITALLLCRYCVVTVFLCIVVTLSTSIAPPQVDGSVGGEVGVARASPAPDCPLAAQPYVSSSFLPSLQAGNLCLGLGTDTSAG